MKIVGIEELEVDAEKQNQKVYVCESGCGRMSGSSKGTSCGKCVGHMEFVKCIRLDFDPDTIRSSYKYHRVTQAEFKSLVSTWRKQGELWAWEFTKVTPLPDGAEEPFFLEKTMQVQHVLFRASMKIPMGLFRPLLPLCEASKSCKAQGIPQVNVNDAEPYDAVGQADKHYLQVNVNDAILKQG